MHDFQSQKFRFWGFASMLLLVYVHGYNLNLFILFPDTLPGEPLGFTSFFEYWVSNGLLRFRLPMLFAISGYLFALGDSKPYLERIGKRLRTIGIPIILWTAIAYVTYILIPNPDITPRGIAPFFEVNPLKDADFLKASLHDKLFKLVIETPLFTFHLWFLRVLLVLNIAYPLLRLAIKPNAVLRWVVFAALFVFWVSNEYVPYLNSEGILFFLLGMHLAYSGGIPAKAPFGVPPKVWIGLWLVLSATKTYLALADPSDAIKPVLVYMHKATIIAGLLGAWYGMDGLVRACMRSRRFVWLSAFSFIIYALHEPLLHIVMHDAMVLAGNTPNYRLITFLVVPTAMSAFCIGVGALLRWASPGVYGVLTGDRGLPKPYRHMSERETIAASV